MISLPGPYVKVGIGKGGNTKVAAGVEGDAIPVDVDDLSTAKRILLGPSFSGSANFDLLAECFNTIQLAPKVVIVTPISTSSVYQSAVVAAMKQKVVIGSIKEEVYMLRPADDRGVPKGDKSTHMVTILEPEMSTNFSRSVVEVRYYVPPKTIHRKPDEYGLLSAWWLALTASALPSEAEGESIFVGSYTHMAAMLSVHLRYTPLNSLYLFALYHGCTHRGRLNSMTC